MNTYKKTTSTTLWHGVELHYPVGCRGAEGFELEPMAEPSDATVVACQGEVAAEAPTAEGAAGPAPAGLPETETAAEAPAPAAGLEGVAAAAAGPEGAVREFSLAPAPGEAEAATAEAAGPEGALPEMQAAAEAPAPATEAEVMS
jgi:two-component system chemotaxis sensor kinase CheA